MADYEFRYSPLTGRLTGNQMIEQTEQAINQLSSLVYSAAGQVEIVSTLANEANENAATALEVANEALATTGRTYITVSGQTDANIYYDSQLIYIADSTSTNIPVADTGMLEVKTNDEKTACEQVFIADSSGDAYYRNGEITAETVVDVTTYSVTWGGWSSQPASQAYVQGELANYLPLSGGTVTGGLTVEGGITGNLSGNATNDGNGNNIVNTYLPLAGGTMAGDISSNANASFVIKHNGQEQGVQILSGENDNFDGATLQLFAPQHSTYAGQFWIRASTKTSYDDADVTHKSYELTGRPDGSLTWANKTIITGTEYSQTFTTNKLAANADQNFTLTAQPKYWSVICNSGAGWGSLIFTVNGQKTLRVTNKNTSTLTDNVNFTIHYIA